MLAAFLMNQASEMWGKKWRSAIIWNLQHGPMRFSQLKSELPGISMKVLSETLKDLEDYELIVRTQYPTIPVKVTYELHADTVPLIEAQVLYLQCLKVYFYKHQDQYEFPNWVIEALEAEQVSNK
jgi:DNA-binding HxlR family transcriptional regulator